MIGFLPFNYKTFFTAFFVLLLLRYTGMAQENASFSTEGHVDEHDSLADHHHHDLAASHDSLDSVKLRKPILYSWQYDKSSYVERVIPVDTFGSRIQSYLPVQRSDMFSITAGSIGRPGISTSAYHASSLPAFVPLSAFNYFYSIDNARWYNAKKPFSQLTYVQSSYDEQILDAFAAVSVTRYWNVGLQLGLMAEKGEKQNESVSAKQLRLYSTHRNGRIFSLVNVCFNRFSGYETGGIKLDSTLNTKLEHYSLSGATSKTALTQLFARHEVNLLKPTRLLDSARNRFDDYRLSVGLLQQADYADRRYQDKSITDTAIRSYYTRFGASFPSYLPKKATTKSLLPISDSLQRIYLKNEAFFRFTLPIGERNRISLVPAIGLEYERNHYISYYQQSFPVEYHSVYAQGFASIKVREIELDATLTQWFLGHKIGDFRGLANLNYALKFANDTLVLQSAGLFESSTPSYFVEKMQTSHLQWDNSFDKTQRTEIRGSLGLADGRASIGAVSSLINNYLYFNQLAVPTQESSVLASFAVYLQKKTKLWRFVLENEIVVQKSSKQSVLPLPTFTMYHAVYYKDKFYNKKLTMRLGLDATYYEQYYAPGYFPLTGVFYNQNTVKTGNYPFLNAFCALQFKRISILFKYNNLLYYSGDNKYFTLAHYAAKKPGFIFGLSWHFHN